MSWRVSSRSTWCGYYAKTRDTFVQGLLSTIRVDMSISGNQQALRCWHTCLQRPSKKPSIARLLVGVVDVM